MSKNWDFCDIPNCEELKCRHPKPKRSKCPISNNGIISEPKTPREQINSKTKIADAKTEEIVLRGLWMVNVRIVG